LLAALAVEVIQYYPGPLIGNDDCTNQHTQDEQG